MASIAPFAIFERWSCERAVIVGVGVHLVDVERFARSLARFGDRWKTRVFSEEEWRYATVGKRSAERLAVRFAAKCAGMRALQLECLPLREVEVMRSSAGLPTLKFHARTQVRAQALGVTTSHVTLTHEGSTAVACVMLEGAGNE